MSLRPQHMARQARAHLRARNTLDGDVGIVDVILIGLDQDFVHDDVTRPALRPRLQVAKMFPVIWLRRYVPPDMANASPRTNSW